MSSTSSFVRRDPPTLARALVGTVVAVAVALLFAFAGPGVAVAGSRTVTDPKGDASLAAVDVVKVRFMLTESRYKVRLVRARKGWGNIFASYDPGGLRAGGHFVLSAFGRGGHPDVRVTFVRPHHRFGSAFPCRGARATFRGRAVVMSAPTRCLARKIPVGEHGWVTSAAATGASSDLAPQNGAKPDWIRIRRG